MGVQMNNSYVATENQVGTGVWKQVYDSTLTAAATNITITDIDLDNAKYWLIATLFNSEANPSNISLYCNSDTTASHYYRQYLTVDNAAISSGRLNTGIITGVVNSTSTFVNGWIDKDAEGYPRGQFLNQRKDPSSIEMENQFWSWNDTTSVTQFILNASIADGFSIGSRITLLKLEPT